MLCVPSCVWRAKDLKGSKDLGKNLHLYTNYATSMQIILHTKRNMVNYAYYTSRWSSMRYIVGQTSREPVHRLRINYVLFAVIFLQSR